MFLVVAMNESAGPLLDELVSLHQDRQIHLTKERVENFLGSAKGKLRRERSVKSSDFGQVGRMGLISEADLPSDIEGLEKLKKVVDNRGQVDYRLISVLVEAYCKEGSLVIFNLIAIQWNAEM